MKDIYINGNSRVSIESENDIVSKVFIDNKEHKFEPDDLQDKNQYALQVKRNKYQKFLNHQFENFVVLTGAGSSVNIGEGKLKGRLLSHLWDDVEEELTKETLSKFCELVHYNDKVGDEFVKNLEKLLSCANSAKEYIKSEEVDIQN